MIINNNLVGNTAFRQYKSNVTKSEKALRHLSSGLAINQAADNAAGLAISEKMRAAIFGLQQATRNVQDGMSLIQTADGALSESHAVLQRMRELSIQAATDTVTSNDREEIQKEIEQLKSQLNEISRTTEFNTKKLLDGTASVLYSVSDNRLQVLVGGSLAQKDAAGDTKSVAGNYKLSINATAGKGQIQSSHVFQAFSGFVGTSYDQTQAGAYSGLLNIKSRGLAEGNYRVMTRETPYGGVAFFSQSGAVIAATAATTAQLGVQSITTTANPNILPYGQYWMDVAKELPFMATFTDRATGSDVIRGVNNIDVEYVDVDMDAAVGGAAGNASTNLMWNHIGGAPAITVNNTGVGGFVASATNTISMLTRLNNTNNVYNHFRVSGVSARQTLMATAIATTSYLSSGTSQIDMTLTYRTHAGDQINLTADYRSAAAQNITAQFTYLVQSAAVTMSIGGTAQTTVNVTAGMDLFAVQAALQAQSIADGWGVNFSVVTGASTYRLQVTNSTAPPNSISFASLPPDDMGLSVLGIVTAGGSASGAALDYQKSLAPIAVGGTSLAGVAAALNGALGGYGVTVVTAGGVDERHLQFTNSSTNYRVEVLADGGSVQTDLGITATLTFGPGTGNWSSGVNVFTNKVISVNVGGQTITAMATSINAAVAALPAPAGGAAIAGFSATVGAGTTTQMSLTTTAASIYQFSVSNLAGTTATELGIVTTVNARGNTRSSNTLFNGRTQLVNVANMHIDDARNSITSALSSLLAIDGLANNGAVPFQFRTDGVGNGWVEVTANASFYDINLTDVVGSVIGHELWNYTAGHTFSRDADDATAVHRDYIKTVNIGGGGTIANAGDNIEEVFSAVATALAADGINATVSWASGLNTPGYDGSHHFGQIRIDNNENATYTRREITFGGGASEFISTASPLGPGATRNGLTWQARDQVFIVASTLVGATAAGGSGATIETIHPAVGWWEGDAGTSNPQLGTLGTFFSELYIPDNNAHGAELVAGDSWAVYTYAQTSGATDRLDVSTYYRDTSAAETRSYHFDTTNANLRSGLVLSQMMETAGSGFAIVNHSIDTGTLENAADVVRYNRRYSASGSYDWYGHISPMSSSSTYFFSNGQSLTANLTASVWRQETDNSSILFSILAGGQMRAQGKGYDRNGNMNDFDVTMAIPTGGPVLIGNIQFDQFAFNNAVKENDRFVLNVCARAGGNGSGYYGTTTNSDSCIRITGNPWSQGGSTMEYRFQENMENGRTFNTLGWFVHPTDGGAVDPNVAVATGQIGIVVGAAGFDSGNPAQPNRWGTDNVRLDINYAGTTDHRAAAVTTGYFFQNKKLTDPTTDYLKNIEYDINAVQNASVMFEVLGVHNGTVALRGQAHIYDKNGNYRYDYEDYFTVGGRNPNVTLFKDEQGNNGLNFTNFDFTDVSKLKAGDKLSLFLSANGEPATSTDDEVFLFAQGDRRNLYPSGWRFNDGVLDNRITTFRTFQVNFDNGEIYDGETEMTFKDFHGGTPSGIVGTQGMPQIISNTVTFDSSYQLGVDMGTAHMYTKLRDIKDFWDASGQYLLDSSRSIQISSNGKNATLLLYGSDTVMDVLDRMNAIFYDQFGGKGVMNEGDRYKYARLIDVVQPGKTYETQEGTMVLRSGIAGQTGDIVMHGDDQLLKALGMQVVRKSEENSYKMDVTNLDTGEVVSRNEQLVGGGATAVALSSNLKVKMDTSVGISNAKYDMTKDDIVLTGTTEDLQLHLADQNMDLQAGAGMKQTMKLELADISSKGLGVADLLVVSHDEANKAIGRLDDALSRVSGIRSGLGAMQNRLEHTMDNLSSMTENLIASESRIRDLDMAKETMEFTKATLLINASYNVMAQTQNLPSRVLELLK